MKALDRVRYVRVRTPLRSADSLREPRFPASPAEPTDSLAGSSLVQLAVSTFACRLAALLCDERERRRLDLLARHIWLPGSLPGALV